MTPFCSASFAIATPVGPSSGQTMRILAPRLMSAVASFSWVASLPCALSMRYSDEVYPASVKACFRYGWSKSTHRVDDVVSGRTTPTCRPLAPLVPAWASALNWVIVDAMLTVKESMPTDGTVTEPDDDAADYAPAALDEADAEGEEEQPAAARARAARATKPILGKRRKYRPPSLLLFTRIPHTLSPEWSGISRPGYRWSSGVPSERS